MGFKRPFADEEFQELPCKHSRPLDYCNKTIQFDEVVPLPPFAQKPAAAEKEGNVCKSYAGESSDNATFDEERNFPAPGLDLAATITWISSSGGENITQSSLPQECFGELDVSQRIFTPVEDVYSFLLDLPPRKQVPLGPEHQADIPEWEGSSKDVKQDISDTMIQNHIVERSGKEKLTGMCVIPMPDLSTPEQDLKVGVGGRDCFCLEGGSVRCVRQHIKEAREEIFKMIGCGKFENLGFYDMGEEVVRNWREEDEQLFHEVVYSNPVSLGRNFWKHLAAAFPSWSKKEIVSYYFNVFVLRRRAAQNRSRMLDIDSDDDEWHGGYGGTFGTPFPEEDEGSDIESPSHQEIARENVTLYTLHHEDGHDNESDSDNDEDDQGDRDARDGVMTPEGHGMTQSDDYKINSTHADKFSGSAEEGLNVEGGLCTSFELPHDMIIHGHTDYKTTVLVQKDEGGLREDDHQKKLNRCNDPVSQAYLLEPCDAKAWGEKFRNVLTHVTDLLPTRSIIEEIFGQGTWDNNTRSK